MCVLECTFYHLHFKITPQLCNLETKASGYTHYPEPSSSEAACVVHVWTLTFASDLLYLSVRSISIHILPAAVQCVVGSQGIGLTGLNV